jgi:hypothetical protein
MRDLMNKHHHYEQQSAVLVSRTLKLSMNRPGFSGDSVS